MGAVIIVGILASMAVSGGITGAVASGRGHNFWLFFLIGAFTSPLFGIILALVMTPSRAQPSRRRRPGTQRMTRGTQAIGRGSSSRPRPGTRARTRR